MNIPSLRPLVFAVLILALLLAGSVALGARPAQAQAALTSNSSTCMSCHEAQYYLYDTGKWYCVSEAQERCTNCHAGEATAAEKQAAHQGLIRHPLNDGGQRCEACHFAETAALVQTTNHLTGHQSFTDAPAFIPAAAPSDAELSTVRERPSLWIVPGSVLLFAAWLWLATRSSHL